MVFCFFFKQKTAYDVRISDWSSDVCSSDLRPDRHHRPLLVEERIWDDLAGPRLQCRRDDRVEARRPRAGCDLLERRVVAEHFLQLMVEDQRQPGEDRKSVV